ncbi:oxidoreductase, zinc-binding dehydrogenase family protein [Paecilomyces variotii No. 5]|uniref:Oxidoreductase, zinc-binding dehydrogenase family protein n=1 Tax=Byssochlamys spectabilis (strain No. 5 / NBRC 109023) TaxID=1356009 RepID=V5FTG9_BYSSN|nr:oxidoreductase, zinc-binding dehydrogenase family protein [Paecilomyces variotii No. 5]
MPPNKAAWLPEAKAYPLQISEAPYTPPRSNEIVVQNAAIGLNHIDYKIQSFAFIPFPYPLILGEEVAGTVVEVGSDVTRFKKGDSVLGLTAAFLTKKNSDAGFQQYTLVEENIASTIPKGLSFETAAGIPLGVATAAAGLFQEGYLGLRLPCASPVPKNGHTVLIWGGASAVGSSAIQLAVNAGYEVITTASPKNFDLIKRLGASEVFDYNSPTVVQDLVDALSSKSFAGALDAVNSGGAIQASTEVLSKLNGSKSLATVSVIPDGLPETVIVKRVLATTIKDNAVGKAVFQEFLPAALADGRFVPLETVAVGKGLESIQSGLDTLKKGVSAKKLVVTLWMGPETHVTNEF